MALKTSSYMILGLVRGGISSGYAIKRFIEERRMSVFWATTFAQIYPDLAQLEEAGYLTHREDPHGARRRRAYSLTPRGERALMSWLRRSGIPPVEVRDEGLLRLAFADNLARDESLALVRRLRERSQEAEREFREQIIPAGETLRAEGLRFPVVMARLGADYHVWATSRLRRLEAELRDEGSSTEPE